MALFAYRIIPQASPYEKEEGKMKGSKGVFFFGVLVIVTAVFICSPRSHAQGTYKWVDEKGQVHFTNDPGSCPKKSGPR